MTDTIGTINNRQIRFADIHGDLDFDDLLPLQNWMLFVIEDNIENPVLVKFAEFCIDNDVQYMCAAGTACSKVDDLFDHLVVCRLIDGKRLPSVCRTDDDVLMTTWHHDFDKGFWFAAVVAEYEDFPFDTVLVANMTSGHYKGRIAELVTRINNGWLPGN